MPSARSIKQHFTSHFLLNTHACRCVNHWGNRDIQGRWHYESFFQFPMTFRRVTGYRLLQSHHCRQVDDGTNNTKRLHIKLAKPLVLKTIFQISHQIIECLKVFLFIKNIIMFQNIIQGRHLTPSSTTLFLKWLSSSIHLSLLSSGAVILDKCASLTSSLWDIAKKKTYWLILLITASVCKNLIIKLINAHCFYVSAWSLCSSSSNALVIPPARLGCWAFSHTAPHLWTALPQRHFWCCSTLVWKTVSHYIWLLHWVR